MSFWQLGGVASLPPPVTQTLVGALGGTSTTSDLYVIGPTDGSTTSVGPIGFAVTGLAFRPSDGVLFGATSNQSAADPGSLITVDPVTGAGTLVGAFAGGVSLADIAFRSDDVLYGYSPSTPRTLYTVNTTTGAATQVSATAVGTPASGFGMSFDSADNLYLFPKTSAGIFYLVDESTGGLTAQASLTGAPATGAIPAVSFDTTDVCYAVVNATTTYYLVTVDIVTSVITNVGTTITLLDAIAWGTV